MATEAAPKPGLGCGSQCECSVGLGGCGCACGCGCGCGCGVGSGGCGDGCGWVVCGCVGVGAQGYVIDARRLARQQFRLGRALSTCRQDFLSLGAGKRAGGSARVFLVLMMPLF